MIQNNEIILLRPSKDLENQIMEYRKDYMDYNVIIKRLKNNINGSCSLQRFDSFDEWLDRVNTCATDEKLSAYETIASTFVALRKSDNKVIGTIQVRHNLTDKLREDGGNIGYGVRPDERKKGYATLMLKLALDFCREIGLDRVLIDCNDTNIASAKTMIKCGAIFDREQKLPLPGGGVETIHQYWIYL
jgi:predicted acetyltransferase